MFERFRTVVAVALFTAVAGATAVEVAKESADIILLQKDLMVLEQGIIEGRKTNANIKMTASGYLWRWSR